MSRYAVTHILWSRSSTVRVEKTTDREIAKMRDDVTETLLGHWRCKDGTRGNKNDISEIIM